MVVWTKHNCQQLATLSHTLSIVELSKYFGVSRHTIENRMSILRQDGYDVKSVKKLTLENSELLIRLWNDNVETDLISRMTGIKAVQFAVMKLRKQGHYLKPRTYKALNDNRQITHPGS